MAPIEPTDSPVLSLTAEPTSSPADDDGCQTISEELCDDGGDFSTLCALLIGTGLGEVLDVETDVFTIFAPNNAAFDKLGEAAIDYLLQPEQMGLLSEILLFHVIPEAKLLSIDLECTELYEMANLEDSRTVCREPFVYQKVCCFGRRDFLQRQLLWKYQSSQPVCFTNIT